VSPKSDSNGCRGFEKNIRAGILKSDGIFYGLTYGNYLCEWVAWLHSDVPIYRGYNREICYLRGNVSYYYEKDTGIRKQAEKFNNKSRNADDKVFRGLVIRPDTAIFVPVMATFYSVGERDMYGGGVLQSIADCQFICRRDISEGGKNWCNLEKKGLPDCKVELNDTLVYCETPSFKLTVTENSPLREHFEVPIEPGTYDTFAAAWAIMINTSNISPLSEGEYRLQYGGFGAGSYIDDSVQDLIVQSGSKFPEVSPVDLEPPTHEELEPLNSPAGGRGSRK
jgi:hypothetical protein